MNVTREKPFCLYPWFHMLVRPNGSAVPCCMWQDENDSNIHYSEFMNSEYMEDFRKRMYTDDLPSRCKSCESLEEKGIENNQTFANRIARSFRVNGNSGPAVKSQEVYLSNICNIKCRSCHSDKSTKWIAEEKKLGLTPTPLQKNSWQLSDSDANNITFLHFMGGEPLLHQDQMYTELFKIKAIGREKQVTVMMFTNMTVSIESKLLDLLLEFKSVQIRASIDAYGILNDYIRSDSKWEDIENNILFLDNLSKTYAHVRYDIVCTLMLLNSNKLDELLQFIEDRLTFKMNRYSFETTFVKRPAHLDVKNMPELVKLKVIKKIEETKLKFPKSTFVLDKAISLIRLDRSISEEEMQRDFIRYNNWLDFSRKQKFSDANPELYEWLNSSCL